MLATNFRFSADHVLYGKLRPYLNKVALPGFDGVCTTEILPILPMDDMLDRTYLWAVLLSSDFVNWASASVAGANLPRLSPSLLAEYEIPLPPLPEQQRIAGILSRADRLRRLRRYALEMSEGYLQSMFLEMFGEAIAGAGATPLVPLSSVCTKITDGTHVTPRYLDHGVPFLSVKNLTKTPGSIDFADVKYISREEHERISRLSNVERGDILYTKVGTYGVPQLVDTDTEFSIFVSVSLLKPDRRVIVPKFLEASLRTSFVKEQADRLVSGIGVPDLHLREIRTILVPLPPRDEQDEFVQLAHRFERLRSQQREALRQAEHLFQTLLHGAFA
ncbi:MAG TPA: restriction endonuclease subunit S [Anaerolineae bacterium]|nr:restriction endonuclease subunit S [Anaerolineae bacterium]